MPCPYAAPDKVELPELLPLDSPMPELIPWEEFAALVQSIKYPENETDKPAA